MRSQGMLTNELIWGPRNQSLSSQQFLTDWKQSQAIYSQLGSHGKSIGCHNFDHFGANFGKENCGWLKQWFLRLASLQTAHTSYSSGTVDATMWSLHFHYSLVGEAAYMETNPKSPTLIMSSPWYQWCHDTCPQF